MQALTQRQHEILQFIRECLTERGMPPTRAEVALRFGFRSKTAAVDHLRALANKGYIQIYPDQSRGIRLLDTPPEKETSSLWEEEEDWSPLIGTVAAGLPIEAIENHEEKLPVPRSMFKTRPTYLLRVRGDSMRDAGILDGDLIAVYKTQVAHKGQIVIARVEQDVTVKYLDYEQGQVKLVPANAAYQPMLISPDNLFIEGVFVGLIRDAQFGI